MRKLFLAGMLCATAVLPSGALAAQIRFNSESRTWTLTTGPVEYRLRQDKQGVMLDYFGPAGMPAWDPGRHDLFDTPGSFFEISGMAEGREIRPEELELVSHETTTPKPGAPGLRLLYRHRRLPLEIEALYAAWGDTGVLTRRLALRNTGTQTLHVESLPELSLRLAGGDYEMTYLWGGWGQERQMATEKLGAGRRSFVNDRGRSSSLYSPWFALHNTSLGVRYMAQLSYSGNWRMDFERSPGTGATPLRNMGVRASLGTLFDFGGSLALAAGARRQLPEVAFTASAGDLDDAANQLHRYQRAYVFPRTPVNAPPLVQFNSWYPFQGKMTVDEMKRCADAAAEIGAEAFVLDSGWYNKKDWSKELGDYEPDKVAFPNGLEELSKHVRSRGMKFGIWVEIENIGTESEMYRKHPDWFLSYGGKPVLRGVRSMLNFTRPDVRQWAHSVVDRLVRDYSLNWIKIDYNLDIGDQFDPPGADRPGNVLLDHIEHYYAWLDEVRAKHPDLVIENCSSGGLRFDTGIMAHTHTTWISDVVAPAPSVQLAYGCTMEFAPEACNHWMVGDDDKGNVKLPSRPGWWDFMFRVPMNGQFGISSRVFEWNAELKKRAAENVALYKRLRGTIAGADVYHLTPPPPNQNPTGWTALQYVSPDRTRSVLMAYRLAGGRPAELFRLRGLAPDKRYQVHVDGSPQRVVSGQEIASQGLGVRLDYEWRATVIELTAER